MVYLQFKELNINSRTVCKTYRGCAALTGVPPLLLKFKNIYGCKTNLKLGPLPHIVYFFFLACKNSDASVFTVNSHLIFDMLEV